MPFTTILGVDMNSVAILYICTGKYDVLWSEFFESAEKYFLCSSKKEYFVFTDSTNLLGHDEVKVHRIQQESIGWPGNTLMRFHFFLRIEEKLQKFDYLVFLNANYEFVEPISEEDFLPTSQNLLVVQHPAFVRRPNTDFVYERKETSTASIPMGRGLVYVCGCLVGGKTTPFLEMCRELASRIEADKGRGITALWHDESHLNRYILDRADYKLLPAPYAYVDTNLWEVDYQPRMVLRDKAKYFNMALVKPSILFRGIIARLGLLVERIRKKARKSE